MKAQFSATDVPDEPAAVDAVLPAGVRPSKAARRPGVSDAPVLGDLD
jgi:hypothetical protein